jgi:hypothetical protein
MTVVWVIDSAGQSVMVAAHEVMVRVWVFMTVEVVMG